MGETCKRGHVRNEENSRQRTVNSGGKTRLINECLACAREAKARKAEGATGASPPEKAIEPD